MPEKADSEGPEIPPRLTVRQAALPFLLIVSFFASRFLFHSWQVRFDASSLGHFWQYIDPELLGNDLFRSLYHLHSQPPLFNLYLGLMTKAFPGRELTAFSTSYIVMGLVMCLAMFLVMRSYVRPVTAFFLTLLFILSPQCILYENDLFYTYPVVFMLCLSALSLQNYFYTSGSGWLVIFFSLLVMVALTQAFFHLVWVLAVFLTIWKFQKHDRRRIVLSFCIPLAVLLAWQLKNLYLFGDFSGSTWLGMNLNLNYVSRMLSETERQQLASQGKLTPLSLVRPFRPMSDYRPYVGDISETNSPVLDRETKSTGYPNFNHLGYVTASRIFLRDALNIMFLYPTRCFTRMAKGATVFFSPSDSYYGLIKNRKHIRAFADAYDSFVLGTVTVKPGKEDETALRICFFVVIAYLFVTVFGAILLWRMLRQSPLKKVGPAVCFIVLWFTVLYVALVGNIIEFGENMRFRFVTEPLVLIMLAISAKIGGSIIRQRQACNGGSRRDMARPLAGA